MLKCGQHLKKLIRNFHRVLHRLFIKISNVAMFEIGLILYFTFCFSLIIKVNLCKHPCLLTNRQSEPEREREMIWDCCLIINFVSTMFIIFFFILSVSCEYIFDCNHVDNNTFHPMLDCQSYWHCISNRAFHYTCPNGTKFDIQMNNCQKSEHVEQKPSHHSIDSSFP